MGHAREGPRVRPAASHRARAPATRPAGRPGAARTRPRRRCEDRRAACRRGLGCPARPSRLRSGLRAHRVATPQVGSGVRSPARGVGYPRVGQAAWARQCRRCGEMSGVLRARCGRGGSQSNQATLRRVYSPWRSRYSPRARLNASWYWSTWQPSGAPGLASENLAIDPGASTKRPVPIQGPKVSAACQSRVRALGRRTSLKHELQLKP